MIRVALALFFGSVLLLEAQTPSQTPSVGSITQATEQLAARISSLLPRRSTVSLEIQSLTSTPAPEWLSFRKLLQDELRKTGVETAGLETAATPPEPRVRVTLSEDARGWLFVAEVASGDSRQVAMLPWSAPSSAQAKPRISITNKFLWAQPDPILDVLLVDSGSGMLVLSVDKVASYRFTGDKWTPSAAASLLLPRPLPRDPRGRLITTAGGFQAYLPVATCTGAWNPELKLRCDGGIANWPGTAGTHWAADRNVLEGDAPAPSFEGWGSDWASIADPCGSGTVDITSSTNNEHDSVRIWDGATPASDPLPLPGPVTALWLGESRREATVVAQNLQTGKYEASRLALACTE
jgi:hypothetical protein